MSFFAKSIMEQKYSHDLEDGTKESWAQISDRVSHHVMKALNIRKNYIDEVRLLIEQRKFIPGGRYLYASGRAQHMTNNCFMFRAEDSREGWADLLQKSALTLMLGGGIGVDYSAVRPEGKPVRKTGGIATGPISLAKILNEAGRYIMQGGSRRCLPDDSKITMGDGSLKRIADIKVGDQVLTRFGIYPVTNVFDQGIQDLIKITTQNGTITTSRTHKLLSTSRARTKTFYTPTEALTLSSKLYRFVTHKTTSEVPTDIVSIEQVASGHTFDIEVADVHEFIADGFVSHNSAIFAGLSWSHADAHKFINAKNWTPEVRHLKEKDFNFPADLDGTNISIQLDDEFFKAYENDNHPKHAQAHSVYWAVVKQMLKTAEPGFSIDIGINKGETLRNACTELCSSDDSDVCIAKGERVLTDTGYKKIEDITVEDKIASLDEASNTLFFQNPLKVWSNGIHPTFIIETMDRRQIRLTEEHEVLTEAGWKKAKNIEITDKISLRPNLGEDTGVPSAIDMEYYMLGWLTGDGWYNGGKAFGFVFGTEEDALSEEKIKTYIRERWDVGHIQEQANGVRQLQLSFSKRMQEEFKGYGIKLAKAIKKEIPDIIWSASIQQKCSFLSALFASDGTAKTNRKNVSLASSSSILLGQVQLLLDELGIYSWVGWYTVPGRNPQGVLNVNGKSLRRFLSMVGFGFSINKQKQAETKLVISPLDSIGRTSRDLATNPSFVSVKNISVSNSIEVFDIAVRESHNFICQGLVVHNCNIGSINMARIESLDEMKRVVDLATLFLLAGTVYSTVPYPRVDQVRTKNRRLGLGLMGLHEWLLINNKKYGPDSDLQKYLEIYATSTDIAKKYADKYDLSHPVKTRACAPTGTIAIVGETTTGIEPLFCVAYKRRYKKGTDMNAFQYVIDPAAQRLIDRGVNPEHIEDAYVLSENIERRIEFQAWVQQYVDHGISSTLNIPAWGSEQNNEGTVNSFGIMLYKYLPKLRGITCYPDGARGGQPLTPVRYATASKHVGEVFYENVDICDLKGGGSCGA